MPSSLLALRLSLLLRLSTGAGATTGWVDPRTLVRVEDPDYPGAVARSATGAVLLEPPPAGIRWRYESIPETDSWPAVEALEATNVEGWHRAGALGQGVRVAIFDLGWYGPDANLDEIGPFLARDCWAHQSCETELDVRRPTAGGEGGVHGIACAEVLHDIAPEAELNLLRVNSFTALENAVAWSVRHDIDLVSMSMSYFNDSFYDGGGPFHDPMVDLESNDVLMVTSAGNNGGSHWFGPFLDADHDERLDFLCSRPGPACAWDGSNALALEARAGTGSLYVNWNQHGRCGDTDLDVWVYDESRSVVVGRSIDPQLSDADQCSPVERVDFYAAEDGIYLMELRRVRGSGAGLKVDIVGRGSVGILDSDPHGSVTDPAADPLAVAVGAVRAVRYLDAGIEGFSSWGPNHAGHPKPEIAGPNGLTTDVYGPEGFYGTSASTPAVAGLVAVLMSDDPSLTPREAFEKLQLYALDDTVFTARPDPRWGAGKARLPLRHPAELPCGQRPLVMPVLLLPLALSRRRRTPRRGPGVAPSLEEDPCGWPCPLSPSRPASR